MYDTATSFILSIKFLNGPFGGFSNCVRSTAFSFSSLCLTASCAFKICLSTTVLTFSAVSNAFFNFLASGFDTASDFDTPLAIASDALAGADALTGAAVGVLVSAAATFLAAADDGAPPLSPKPPVAHVSVWGVLDNLAKEHVPGTGTVALPVYVSNES